MHRKENKPLLYRTPTERGNVKDNEMKNEGRRNVCKEWEGIIYKWKRTKEEFGEGERERNRKRVSKKTYSYSI